MSDTVRAFLYAFVTFMGGAGFGYMFGLQEQPWGLLFIAGCWIAGFAIVRAVVNIVKR